MEDFLSRVYDDKWVILGLLLTLFVLWIALPFLSPIVFALFIYYVTRPIKRRLQPYLKNEVLIALLCLLLFALPLISVLVYTLLLAVNQLNTLLSDIGLQALPLGSITNLSYIVPSVEIGASPGSISSNNIAVILQRIYHQLQNYSETALNLKDFLVSMGLAVVDVSFKFFLMLVIAFLLLVNDDRLAKWFRSTFPGLVQERNGVFSRYVKAVDEDLEDVFFGNVLSVIILAIIAAIVYSLLNAFAPAPSFLIPFPLLLGILCGLFAFLPVMGAWMVDVPILVYAALRSYTAGTLGTNGWYLIVMAVVIFVFVENLPGYLLRPLVSHGKVDVGLLMLTYIVGPIIFGIPGLFIGAILLIFLTHYFNVVVPELGARAH